MATLPAIGPVMTRKMHQKITCRAQILTPATAGEQKESLQDIAKVWADITPMSGDFITSARQSRNSARYKVHVRYQERLLASRNILWQGQSYQIKSLLDPDNRKHILEFEMTEDLR